MTFAEIELHNRVGKLEQALLKLCSATMNLVQVIDPPKGSTYSVTDAVKNAVEHVREAAEIVSGEHAPR